ncbi:MAG: hypothetical protein J6M95_03890 [Bacilli bacterium]|nr:hypothetical protein [Bacilli bacterium]
MTTLLKNNWYLTINDKKIPASVPGDITIDAFKANLIDNPYFAKNYKKAEWIQRSDFVYENEIDITEAMLSFDVIDLVFKGIDLYSDIYINGHLLGSTKNMFLKYGFDIKPFVKLGKNLLEVKMKSTLNMMDTFDCKDYFSIFNIPRIFVRKAQCHFGWDWAPRICGYGIWDIVYINCHDRHQISDIKVITHNSGDITFHLEINYNVRLLIKQDGSPYIEAEEKKDDKFRISLSNKPNGEYDIVKEFSINERKSFFNLKIENPHLWWPLGYGDHPLYKYKVELIRDNKVVDIKENKFAFREVKLLEEPTSEDRLGFRFYINNTPIFIKGSNWVPAECFTGVIEDEKYVELINLAKEGNFNTLRVWGGGIYEKDIFYDLCDENGLLVWQDLCLACADIPEEDQDFVSNLLEEVTYQVKRLRNHPSLIYWCGGNEKTGSYGLSITHGDFLIDVILPGLISSLDTTRPYRRQSPYSYTDIGNEKSSGETHHNCFEQSLSSGMDSYRTRIASFTPSFVSECAIMGPSSLETLRKIFPEEHMWPMDEMWKDRLMENPYAAILMDFPHRELHYAEELYGKVNGVEDFVKKAMIVHSECIRAELEYARSRKWDISGYLNWMFDDIWPSATWATIDYFLEPKEVYYQMKRSYEPVYASFVEDEFGDTYFFVSNDTNETIKTDVEISEKTYDGKVIFTERYKDIKVNNNHNFKMKIGHNVSKDNYLVIKYFVSGKERKTIYSKDLFKLKKFSGDFEYSVKQIDKKHIKIKITAHSFVKSLFIHFENNYLYRFSDNYLNLEKDDEVTVDVYSSKDVNISSLKLDSYKG